jgi:hypothetical protein
MDIQKVDPVLMAACTDDIGAAHEENLGFVPFADLMAGVVMSKVSGDELLALAVLKRIQALVVAMAADPAIVGMFANSNPKSIPRELTHAAAITPLFIGESFDRDALRNAALLAADTRGRS